ncbi:MAG: hypothetical protein RIR53_1703 [Bacteroidota bacterium]
MTDEFFGVYLIYADRWGLDTLAYRYKEDVDDWTREGGPISTLTFIPIQ